MRLELRVRYIAEGSLQRTALTRDLAQAKKIDIQGHEAFLKEPDQGDREVFLKVIDTVYVEAEGSMSMDELQQAVQKVDLKKLEQECNSGEIFKPGFEDRLAEKILSRSDIELLVPEKVGPLAKSDFSSRREIKKDPMQCSIEARHGSSKLKIIDFGTLERTQKSFPTAMLVEPQYE
jgi:hypothetical protein